MGQIICSKTALEYWRLYGRESAVNFAKQRGEGLPAGHEKHAAKWDLMSLGLSQPINLMVGDQNSKRKTKIFQTRVYTGPIPDGSIVRIGDWLSVCSPEFCFFQMAGELPLVKLIELGFELCGSSSLAAGSEPNSIPADEPEYGAGNPDKTLYGYQQLTNTKALKTFTKYMAGVRGQKKAYRALRYIADGSASPMETILFMLLTLPHKLGGFELPAPELNKRIDLKTTVKQRAKHVSEKTFYICDLFWPKANLAVEYDSDIYHTGADRIAKDAKKRLDLEARGITPITVTSSQIRNAIEFENLAGALAKKLNKRLRYQGANFSRNNQQLRSLLL